MSSEALINPEEFVKTKHHCYVVKEYANGGTVAQLLLYRSQINRTNGSVAYNKRLSEGEAQRVLSCVLQGLRDVYEAGLAVWDLSPETLLL